MHQTAGLTSRLILLAGFALAWGMGDYGRASGPYTPERPRRPKVLMDYYHHTKPELKIGNYVVTGGYNNNLGRYALDDFSHTNSFDPLVQLLEDEFAICAHKKPLTKEYLKGVGIVFIFTPDSRQIRKDIPLISDAEIGNLVEFVEQGGSLLLMVNSHHPTEKFEQTQFRKLFRKFGLDWNQDDTHYVNIKIGPYHPYFYDMDIFHYGAGCTLRYTGDTQPLTLLHVHEDKGCEPVQGPGISLVRHGKGKVIACGDTGSWGANVARPWSENGRALLQLFRLCRRDTGIRPPQYSAGQTLSYKMFLTRVLQSAKKNTLNEVPQPDAKDFVITKSTKTIRFPYLESSAQVNLTCTEVDQSGAMNFQVGVENLRRFDRFVTGEKSSKVVTIKTNRLGSIGELICPHESLMTLAPDLAHLIAFIPDDGVGVGDRWKKISNLKVNPLQGIDLGPVRPVETTMCYVGDEEIKGRNCRLVLTSAYEWLSDLDVSIEDLLPKAYGHRVGGSRLELQDGRGGRFLFKRQQWIDRDTGVLVRARTQTRIVAWVRDLRKPMKETISDIDCEMITVAAQDVIFELQ